MDPITMDWEKDGGLSVPVYPEGTYKVKIKGFTPNKAKTGTPQYKCLATIIEPEQYAGQPIVDFLAITEAAKWKIANLVKACGINPTGKCVIGSTMFNRVLEQCVGRTLYWHVLKDQGTNGRDRNQTDDYQPDPDAPTIASNGTSVPNEEDVPDFLKG